jgi:hypothetical protein
MGSLLLLSIRLLVLLQFFYEESQTCLTLLGLLILVAEVKVIPQPFSVLAAI